MLPLAAVASSKTTAAVGAASSRDGVGSLKLSTPEYRIVFVWMAAVGIAWWTFRTQVYREIALLHLHSCTVLAGEVGNVRLRGKQGVAQAVPVLPGPVPAGKGGAHARQGNQPGSTCTTAPYPNFQASRNVGDSEQYLRVAPQAAN